MDKNLPSKIFGFRATLMHADTMVLDRWLWLKKRLPRTNNAERVLDIGCGSGAFTIGAAKRGYYGLGLSWDERNQRVAQERAKICKAEQAEFQVLDVRQLGGSQDLINAFDVLFCFENIEHILDDRKLMIEMFACLKKGGRLLLSTPNYYNKEISKTDIGPFQKVEDGSHMRKGYTANMLIELCAESGFQVDEISGCSGWFSQKITGLFRLIGRINYPLAWLIIFPLRILPPLFDGMIRRLGIVEDYSICLVASKKRF